jgi:uncharacterized oligopeptide transporter (OPT) family protein
MALIMGMIASGLLMAFWEGSHLFETFASTKSFTFDSTYLAGPLLGMAPLTVTRVGVEWSLLAIGSGMIIGLRINISMLIGTVLSWVVAPYALVHYGLLKPDFARNDVLFWVMWPATGLMVAGGLAGLILRWRILVRSFQNLSSGVGADEFPLRWVIVGSIVCATALVAVQKIMFDQPLWITIVAILFSVPLALVGLRVLGETNWGPISALSNLMQGVFALLAPGNVAANMVASGTTGTVASDSQAVMQDYKAGEMIGSSPRYLTYMQLLATPVGAAAVAWMYPVLRETYTIGEHGLSSPISRKWAGFAEILSRGVEALPEGALTALVIGVVVGIVLAIIESSVRDKTFIPSPTGLGIGMLVPASVIVTMVIGAIFGKVWEKTSPTTSDRYQIPLASGLIAGEALVAVIVPLLVLFGLINA